MPKILIEVTKEDISTARGLLEGNPAHGARRHLCPIAQAVRRFYPRAEVGLGDVNLERGTLGIWSRAMLPDQAIKFRRSFDGSEVPGTVFWFLEPFSFELDVPEA